MLHGITKENFTKTNEGLLSLTTVTCLSFKQECVCVWCLCAVCICVHVDVLAHTCVETGGGHQILLLPYSLLRQGLSLDLALGVSAGLTGQRAPWIPRSPHHGAGITAVPFILNKLVFQTQVLMLAQQALNPQSQLPSLRQHFYCGQTVQALNGTKEGDWSPPGEPCFAHWTT